MLSFDEYLYLEDRDDCEFVNGLLEPRYRGSGQHSRMLSRLIVELGRTEQHTGIRVFPSIDIFTRPTCLRIADLAVTLGCINEERFVTPPFLCVEILSPEDEMSKVEARLQEFLNMGVPFVWLIDPVTYLAWTYTAAGKVPITDGILQTAGPSLEFTMKKY